MSLGETLCFPKPTQQGQPAGRCCTLKNDLLLRLHRGRLTGGAGGGRGGGGGGGLDLVCCASDAPLHLNSASRDEVVMSVPLD